jgi:nitrogen fixation NifU-like protein
MQSLEDALQQHSKKFISMVHRQERYGALDHPDGYGTKKGICGDTVEFYLSVQNGIVQTVAFELDGCFHTMACANAVSLIAEGKNVADSWDITPENIINYLETLPEDHHHCAELVIGTFYLALANYHELQRQPWKKSYSRR